MIRGWTGGGSVIRPRNAGAPNPAAIGLVTSRNIGTTGRHESLLARAIVLATGHLAYVRATMLLRHERRTLQCVRVSGGSTHMPLGVFDAGGPATTATTTSDAAAAGTGRQRAYPPVGGPAGGALGTQTSTAQENLLLPSMVVDGNAREREPARFTDKGPPHVPPAGPGGVRR